MMMTRFRKWLYRLIYCRLLSGCLWVILDPQDNSVTFSKSLFRFIEVMGLGECKAYVFHIPKTGMYGFTLNPAFKTPTQLNNLQYNKKYKCAGFISLVPTVNRILYDYNLSHSSKVKLRVKVMKTNGIIYYQICRKKSSQ